MTIRAKGYAPYLGLMPSQTCQLSALHWIPQAHCFVTRTDAKRYPSGSKAHTQNSMLMASQPGQFLTSLQVPQPYCLVNERLTPKYARQD